MRGACCGRRARPCLQSFFSPGAVPARTSAPAARPHARLVATRVAATISSERVPTDPDDPAIWLHPTDAAQSLVIGTNKVAAPDGALVVYGLDGKIRQTISGIDRPNNVDVEYGFRFDGVPIDIAVATERLKHRLRVFRIDPVEGRLVGIGEVPVLAGQAGEAAEPMGIALYKRPTDSRIFAIVAPKTGGTSDICGGTGCNGGARHGQRPRLVRSGIVSQRHLHGSARPRRRRRD